MRVHTFTQWEAVIVQIGSPILQCPPRLEGWPEMTSQGPKASILCEKLLYVYLICP